MRRGIGLGAIQKHKLEQEKYRDKGNEIQENQFEQMTKQLEVFKVNLEEFATKHKNEIRRNSEFRKQFQVWKIMYAYFKYNQMFLGDVCKYRC